MFNAQFASENVEQDYTVGLFHGLPTQDDQDHPLTERVGRHRKPSWLRERGCNK